MTNKGAWIWFFAVCAIFCTILSIISVFFSFWIATVGVPVIVTFSIYSLLSGWTTVEQNRVRLVEVKGSFTDTWVPGKIYFRFPYLGIVREAAEVYLGQIMINLYMDDNQGDPRFGKVDFTDSSAPVTAFIYFKITNPELATYGINDVMKAVEERMDSEVRGFLAPMSIDQANRLKDQLTVERILGNVRPNNKDQFPAHDDKENINTWKEMKEQWGVEVISVVISDIAMSEDVIKAREKMMTAEAEKKAAEMDKKKKVIEAEGDAKATIIKAKADKEKTVLTAEGRKAALEAEAVGRAAMIKNLTDNNMDAATAAAYLTEMNKWDNVQRGTVIIDGNSNSAASFGARFQVGVNAAQGNNP